MKAVKRTLSLILCCAVLLCALPFSSVSAVEECGDYSGSNVLANRYYHYYAKPMTSYLFAVSGGYMRFQAGVVSGAYLVEYYDTDYNFLSKRTITAELSLFGGFYTNGTNHFVLTGQTNMEESASVECFRVTKYDTDWNRLSSAGVFDCNTIIPFDAGSARFAEADGSIIIRTSHEMYTSSDGRNHQANYTLLLDIETMSISGIGNMAYSSHSFNQFVKADGSYYITVDHGDAYPRSIVLVATEKQGSSLYKRKTVNLFSFVGGIGENYTGAAVGGFEISQSSYLTAFCSVEQNDSYQSNKTRNVFVAVTNRIDYTTTVKPITAMSEGETTAEPPQLVKLSDNSFLLIWQIGTMLYYCYLDGNGNMLGEPKCFENAAMSDCQPIAVNGKAVWYSYTGNVVSFYEIGEGGGSITKVDTGHRFKVLSHDEETPEKCTLQCEICGKIAEYTTQSRLTILFSEDGRYYSSRQASFDFTPGASQPLYFCNYYSSDAVNEVVISVANGKNVTIAPISSRYYSMNFPKNGLYKITFTYKYNPFISKTYRISVGEYIELGDVNADGLVDNQDAALILRYDAGNSDTISNGDVNYDGKTDSLDAAIILKYDAGLIAYVE